MSALDLIHIKGSVEKLCKEVASFVREQLDSVTQADVETKEMNSLVSYVDKHAEIMLVQGLRGLVPDTGFITEENTVQKESKDAMWIIDPLDGTTNFLYKIPHFAISIALQQSNEIGLGVVYEVMSDTSFSAVLGMGAWENNKPIKINSHRSASEALVVTGFPYNRDSKIDERLEVLKYCILNYRGIRRLGSAALDLAFVASGRFDIYYENSLNIWDIAAGSLIVTEAGGLISDYSGGQEHLNKGSVIASTPLLHPEILAVVTKHLS